MPSVFLIPPAPPRALWFLALIVALLFALLLLFLYFAHASRYTRYELSSVGLAIRGTFYGRQIAWDDLRVEEARVVNLAAEPEMQPNLRTNGIGLPGYQAGWFRLRRAGRGLVFLTDRSRVVVVPTALGYTLLLSVNEPEKFVDALRNEELREHQPTTPR
jgi:hypothetical protein